MRRFSDHVTVVLYPPVTETSWSEIEAFGADVRNELESRSSPTCLVDLTPLTYMGSAIVALIVRVWKVVQSKGGRMVVVSGNPVVLDVIRLAGLDKVWTIVPEISSGRKKLGVRIPKDEAPTQSVMEVQEERNSSSSNLLYFALGVVAVLFALMVAMLIVVNL